MRLTLRILFAVAGCALAANLHAARGNPANGAQLAQVCQACHGPDGNGVGDPQYPIIAGQYADYLEHALKAYRSGERNNAIMQGFAKNLSDQDIADLSAYFASQKSKLEDLSKRR
jgi:cytochrome c553